MNDDAIANSEGAKQLPVRRAEAAPPAEPERQVAPWVKLHGILRGRYPLAIVLAVLGAVAGGAAGWFTHVPVYQSQGWISIKPRVDKIIWDTEDSRVMPMFDAFVDSQVQLMGSPRVLDMAMASETWNGVKGEDAPLTQSAFAQPLSIRRAGRGTMVAVSYTHTRRQAAQAAVDAVIDSYMRLYGEQDVQSEAMRLRVLTDRRTSLSNQLASLEQQVRAIADLYATDSLEPHYNFKLQELQKLEQALKEVDLALATAGVDPEADVPAPSATAPTDRPVEPDAASEAVAGAAETGDQTGPSAIDLQAAQAELAEAVAVDPAVRAAYASLQSAQRNLENARERYGDQHRAVERAVNDVEAMSQALDLQMMAHRNQLAVGGVASGGSDMMVRRLRVQRQQLQRLHEAAQAETVEIGRKRLEVDALQREIERVRVRLEETKFAIEKINVESAVSGRVEVVANARLPEGSANEGKRKQLAVLGFGGGGCAGLGIVVLMGLMDRRLRYLEQVMPDEPTEHDLQALGILPQLPEQQESVEQAQMTAYAVHHIRTMLQVTGHGTGPVLAVTGPASGSGKTSLTVALGLSFAASGAKTLLVDADFIGGGLTLRMEQFRRERLGGVLLRTGAVTQDQLDEAARVAGDRRIRIGEALVEMGILDQAQLDAALSLQEQTKIGLLEALRGSRSDTCVAETGVRNLWILPIPGGSAAEISAVSPQAVRRVLDELSVDFDQVLMDLGPMPGSVEASILAAKSDRNLVVVSRGDLRPQYDRCVRFLRKLGTPIAGVVFNRAGEVDVERSAALSAVSRSRANQSVRRDADAGTRFGPLGAGMTRAAGEADAEADRKGSGIL